MAVVEDLTGVSVSMVLNDGTNEDGDVRTASQSLGKMDVDNFDNQKAMNIINAATPILSKDIYDVRKRNEYSLSND